MPNKRAKGQKLLPIPVKVEFLRQFDAALEQLGLSNRSAFVRESVWEKLKILGVALPRGLIAAPPRTQSHAGALADAPNPYSPLPPCSLPAQVSYRRKRKKKSDL